MQFGWCEGIVVYVGVCSSSHNLYVFGVYRNPDLSDKIFDCLLTARAKVQSAKRASFLLAGYMSMCRKNKQTRLRNIYYTCLRFVFITMQDKHSPTVLIILCNFIYIYVFISFLHEVLGKLLYRLSSLNICNIQ